MELQLKERSGFYKLELKGHIEVKDVQTLEMYLRSLRGKGIDSLMLKLTDLESIVSSGIGVLMGLSDELEAAGGQVIVVDPNVKVLSILKMLGLDEVFRIVSTEEEALKLLGAS